MCEDGIGNMPCRLADRRGARAWQPTFVRAGLPEQAPRRGALQVLADVRLARVLLLAVCKRIQHPGAGRHCVGAGTVCSGSAGQHEWGGSGGGGCAAAAAVATAAQQVCRGP